MRAERESTLLGFWGLVNCCTLVARLEVLFNTKSSQSPYQCPTFYQAANSQQSAKNDRPFICAYAVTLARLQNRLTLPTTDQIPGNIGPCRIGPSNDQNTGTIARAHTDRVGWGRIWPDFLFFVCAEGSEGGSGALWAGPGGRVGGSCIPVPNFLSSPGEARIMPVKIDPVFD